MSFVHADKVPAEILGWGEELAAIRHEVHSQPELGFDTEKTVARIVKVLSGWGIENIDTELVKGGVIVVVDGERPGKTQVRDDTHPDRETDGAHAQHIPPPYRPS